MGSQWENSLKDATIKRLIDENNDLKRINQDLTIENEWLKNQQKLAGLKPFKGQVKPPPTDDEDPLDYMLQQVRSLINQLEQC